jgi:hypothetical protein
MPKDWKDYTDDELLNFDDPQTAEIARYDRIMQKHANDAMLGLKGSLAGLSETMDKQADAVISPIRDLKGSLETLGDCMSLMHEGLTDKADEAFKRYEREARARAQQQKAVRWLTYVIAASTVAYTLITGASVWATFQSNHIRKEMLEFQEHLATAPKN